MKILFFDPYFQGKYGNARYIIDLFAHEDYLDCSLYTCSPSPPSYLEDIGKKEKFFLLKNNQYAELNKFGGSISQANFFRKLGILKNVIGYSFKFREICKRESIDIVHCNSIRAILTIGLGAKFSGCKIVLYIKSNLLSFFYIFLAFLLADKILFQTEINKQRTPKSLLYLFKSKFFILKNAIDMNRVNRVLDEDNFKDFKVDNTFHNLIYLGSIVERKGLKFLVEAIGALKKYRSKINLYIVGDFEADQQYTLTLKNLINHYQLTGNILFLGHQNEPLSYLKEVDFLVLPSLDEGVPKSVIEAICIGTPVIATDVGGTRELVSDKENGKVVFPGNSLELQKAIQFCIQNKADLKTFAKNKSMSFREEFSFPKHCKNLSLIYKDLLSS